MNTLTAREMAFRAVAREQRGCRPYENRRILTVKGHQDGMLLETFLSRLSGWTTQEEREEGLAQGRVTVDGYDPRLQQVLRGGNRVGMTFLNVVEPVIATDIRVLYEDDDLLVVVKPAPMPVHPSGRYNKHSLTEIARVAWPDITLKPVHRLDVNTAGLLLLGKKGNVARKLIRHFRDKVVRKTYLARVQGQVSRPSFTVDSSIARNPGRGGLRAVVQGGLPAQTDVKTVRPCSDGTTLIRAYPRTGRTNQIRLHMQSVGHPVMGDRAYGRGLGKGEAFANPNDRLYLFAHAIQFPHPVTEEPMTFRAEPPEWFSAEPEDHTRTLR